MGGLFVMSCLSSILYLIMVPDDWGKNMKKLMVILFMLSILSACENNEGQYRHDNKHHTKNKLSSK